MEDAHNVWDELPDWGGVGARRLVRAGSLGGSVWEVQPGRGQFVYHFHHASEELLVVLRGSPTVRMHDGDHQLGEAMSSPFRREPRAGTRSGTRATSLQGWSSSRRTRIPTSPSTTAARSASGSVVAAGSSAWRMRSNTAALSSGRVKALRGHSRTLAQSRVLSTRALDKVWRCVESPRCYALRCISWLACLSASLGTCPAIRRRPS